MQAIWLVNKISVKFCSLEFAVERLRASRKLFFQNNALFKFWAGSYIITNIFQNDFFLYNIVMRYIVATGYPSNRGVKTEVVDLSDPSKSCILEDIPY